MQFIFFIIFFVGILFFSHYFVYFSLIKFFEIANPKVKTLIGLVLFVLPISFIISSIIAHWKENIFTRVLYFVSSLWLGVLTNLVIIFVLIWLLFGLTKAFHFQADWEIFGISGLIIALIVSSYGVWNSFHPVVKNITVKIKNLPTDWQNKKIVQISDVHLGYVFRDKFLQNIVEKINKEKPELVVITGDLFDGMEGRFDVLVNPLNNIESSLGTYFITGNHETYAGVERVYNALKTTKVNILDDKMVNLFGLQLIGVSYPERNQAKDIVKTIETMKDFDSNQPSVLLLHSPVQVEKIKQKGVNFMLSGHTHKGQLFPFNFITSFVYHGFDYGLNKIDNFSIYTSSGVGGWGPTMRTGNRPEIVVIEMIAK